VIRQEEQRQKKEDAHADPYVPETKPPIATSKLPFFSVLFTCLRKELRNMLRLELLEDWMVRGTAPLGEAGDEFLYLKTGSLLPLPPNHFGIQNRLVLARSCCCDVTVFRCGRLSLRRLAQ